MARNTGAALCLRDFRCSEYGSSHHRQRGVRASDMSKKYEVVRDKIPLPGGVFVEALRMALVDLSCFGEGNRLDQTGYPHESEAAAMMSDWAALGVDLRAAAEKVQIYVQEEGESDGGGERRAEEAVKRHTD